MEDRIEESRSHAVYFPNDVTKSANALDSFVCLYPLKKKTFMKVSVQGKGRAVLFFSTLGCSNNLKRSWGCFSNINNSKSLKANM